MAFYAAFYAVRGMLAYLREETKTLSTPFGQLVGETV